MGTDTKAARIALCEIADSFDLIAQSLEEPDPPTVFCSETIRDHAQKIREICDLKLTRRPSKKRAKSKAKPITAQVIRDVLETAVQNPDLSLAEIGRLHDMIGGRVSEILAGQRYIDENGLAKFRKQGK